MIPQEKYHKIFDLIDSEQYSPAEILVTELIQSDPADAGYRDIYSNLLAYGKNFKDALVQSKAAIMLEPKDAQYQNNLGVIYGMMDDLQNARVSLENALELDPSSATSAINLSEALYNLKMHEDAYKIINSYISEYPDNPVIHEKLIHFSAIEKNVADILRHYIKFIELKYDTNFNNNPKSFLETASNYLLNFKSTIYASLGKSPFSDEKVKNLLINLIEDLIKEEENKGTYKKLMSKYKKNIPSKLFEKIDELSGSIDLGFITHSDYEISDRGFE